jgi:hypothetical protein
MSVFSVRLASACIAIMLAHPVEAGIELTASDSRTIQPTGPRSGDAGNKYFNIEGKANDKFASFGVLVFPFPEEVREKKAKSATLTLVQSIPAFAKDGAIRIFLALSIDAIGELKFDGSTADGVGSQIKDLRELGSGSFKKVETGKTDTFSLTFGDTVYDRIGNGGRIYLVIVPADAKVAATYFGATEDAKERSPKLTLEAP